VIHSHYWLSGIAAEALAQGVGRHVPMVHMFHTLGHMKNQIARDAQRARAAKPARRRGARRAVADRLIAATPAEVEQLV
jgi:D-inositol-3-phosphate glycosyltransferase